MPVVALSEVEYQQVVVTKPWGYEYLIYQNELVGIWYLYLKHGARTSLHCHPRKKTGLILLSGEAVVSFLNDSVPLKSPTKLMIRPGLFHATQAISSEGIILLELETPVDKTNLVRFEDKYGREEKPYEGSDKMMPLTDEFVRFSHPVEGQPREYRLHGNVLTIEKTHDVAALRGRPEGELIAVLDGGLMSNTDELVLGAGDVVTPETLDRLTTAFTTAPEGISMLTIRNVTFRRD